MIQPLFSPILQKEVLKRRTFAIISHPDAGKTTLTEKLLLYGGAIHLAGAVRAKARQRQTTSDWMEIEKQRGISVSSSVLRFEYQGFNINLLDTPGHKDFSEDTYRTLTAADAAVMLIDAAKGIEAQTQKLFEVCRMRAIPIFTFINKLDRPSRDPFDLLHELEKILKIQSYAMSWPIGLGDRFKGIYDRTTDEILLFQTGGEANGKEKRIPKKKIKRGDPLFIPFLLKNLKTGEDEKEIQELYTTLQEELELLEHAGEPFHIQAVLEGKLTPVFFGSAMNNFGVQHFLEQFIHIAPPPKARKSHKRVIEPTESRFSGFIFKIQANIDPSHRDRIAFLRVCSGKFIRNLSVTHARLNKIMKLSKPFHFFAQERIILEEAWPGDIIGLLDTSGELRIGDTLCEGEPFEFEEIPRFTPEYFANIFILDPMKRKQLKKGLEQLSEEGVIQVYRQQGTDKDPVLGAVGNLQFEVLQHRLKTEYQSDVKIERLPYLHARWIQPLESKGQGSFHDTDHVLKEELSKNFDKKEETRLLEDRDGVPVVLFKSNWGVKWAEENYKNLSFLKLGPQKKT